MYNDDKRVVITLDAGEQILFSMQSPETNLL